MTSITDRQVGHTAGQHTPGQIPRDRDTIDALPYRLYWGHWSVQAWCKTRPVLLAEVSFPIVNGCGPWTSKEAQRNSFAQLDTEARAAIASRTSGEST